MSSMLAMIAAMDPLWAIDPIVGANLWEAFSKVDATAHLAHYSEGRVLLIPVAMKDGVAVHVDAGADWTGVTRRQETRNLDGSSKPYPMDEGVALLAVEGPMTKGRAPSTSQGTSMVESRRVVRQATADNDVKAVLFRFDSPGGQVAGGDDLAADVRKLAATKPTYAYAEDACCSMAYYIASQCNAIYANRAARIGSIATILTMYDTSDMAERIGAKPDPIVPDDAPYKSTGMPGSKLTADQRAYLKDMVTTYANQFRAAVQSGRNMTNEQMSKVIDGRCFTADKSKELGLIDGICSYDAVLDKLKTIRSQGPIVVTR